MSNRPDRVLCIGGPNDGISVKVPGGLRYLSAWEDVDLLTTPPDDSEPEAFSNRVEYERVQLRGFDRSPYEVFVLPGVCPIKHLLKSHGKKQEHRPFRQRLQFHMANALHRLKTRREKLTGQYTATYTEQEHRARLEESVQSLAILRELQDLYQQTHE